ncbi:hypothetical protein LB519_14645 [Mesorhizobium sp. AD1-1]|uniref:hypothetical protein n=1 Tax=Mesorhizobium sp. AD1-1 TaxID=2876621 RepID=UPI001CCA3E41|nr:hypothetical protein [Mesorhizobium sp. AD1-1]MBZ9719084.1 hypothetical protein [Mesorhizobium sp. AD1-1]
MTTTIKVNTNGNYVSTIKINGVEAGSVGPGTMVEKSFGLPHNDGGPSVFEVYERQATAEEIEASKAATA